MSKRIFIVSGEPSGDLHGANLVKALLSKDPEIIIECWGGDRMKAAGATVRKHIDELAFMGFIEVLLNLRTILSNFKKCEKDIKHFQPDLVLFIDYPGFNLRMAAKVKKLGIQTAYYISPQIWAWKESRVEKIKRLIDHVFVILPFEKDFYAKHGVQAEFVGHPLLDEIEQIHIDRDSFLRENNIPTNKPIIALLPGSRTQEIVRLMAAFSSIVKDFPDHQFVLSKVSWQSLDHYGKIPSDVCVLEGKTYRLLKVSEAAIVTSGTATLETALIQTPQVVVYKANALSVLIARQLIKVKYISLVNLIMDELIVTELIQGDVSRKALVRELTSILPGGNRREMVLHKYAELIEKIGTGGASNLVASRLLKIIATPSKSPKVA